MPQTYQERMEAEAARQQRVAAQQAARRQEIEYLAAMQAEADARKQRESHEQELFYARVAARRERELRGETPAVEIPTFADLYGATRDAQRQAAAAAEAARIAAITPAQQKRTQLSWSEQQRRAKWEAINPGLTWIED